MLQAAQAFEFAWDLQAQPLQAPLTCRWELRCPAVPGSAAQVAFRHFDTAIEVRLTVSDPATRPVGNLAGRLRDGAGTFVSEGSSLFLRLEMLPTSTGLQTFAASFACIRPTTLVGRTPEGYVWAHVPVAHVDRPRRATPVQFVNANRMSSIIRLAHSFPLFGSVFNAMMISADGFVAFGDPGTKALTPTPLPSADIPLPLIAVFWASTWGEAAPGAGGWRVTYGACSSSDGMQGTAVVFEGVPVAQDATATYQLTLWSSGAFQISLLDTAAAWAAAASVVVGWTDGSQGESTCASDSFSGVSSCAVTDGGTYYVVAPTSTPASNPCDSGSPMLIAGDARRAQPVQFDALRTTAHQLGGCQWSLSCRPGTIARITFDRFNSTEDTELLLVTDTSAPSAQSSLGGLTGWVEDPRDFTATSHSLSMVWVGSASPSPGADASYLKGFYATAECVAVSEVYTELVVNGPPVDGVVDEAGHRSLFRFQAVAGQSYIMVVSTDSSLDALLWVLDGSRIVARSDDDGEGDDPLIVWSAPESRSFGVVVRGWADSLGAFSVRVETAAQPECSWQSLAGKLETEVLSELRGGADLIGRCQHLCVEHQNCLAVDLDSTTATCRLHSSAALAPPVGSGHRRAQGLDRSPLSMIQAHAGASILSGVPGWQTFVLGALLPPEGGAFVLSSIAGLERHCRWYLDCPQVPAAHRPEFILSELVVPIQTVGGVELQASDPAGTSMTSWTTGYPTPPVVVEKGVPLSNCSTPLKSFSDPIPGQLVGFNLPCTDSIARFGRCIDDHLILNSAEECASVCLAVSTCSAFEYGIGDRSPRFQFCYLNTATIDGITGTYGALAGVNYYSLQERRCLIETEDVSHRFVSDSYRMRVDFIDLEATASSFQASFACAQTCYPSAEPLEERLCYGQIPCPADCEKGRCDCPAADGPEAMSSCHELQARGFETGVQTLIINGELRKVYCDMDTDGGGWTLVGSSKSPLSDRGGPWHADLSRQAPSERNDWIWSELRELYPGQVDLRFSCNTSTTAENDADIRFSDVLWYDTLTSSDDEGEVCFFAGEPAMGSETVPAPARRDLILERDLSWGKRFSSGFLESESSCSDPSSFAIDFGVGGLSAAPGKSDGTNWGIKRGVAECGTSRGQEAEDGAYQIWFRESTAQYSWRRDDYTFVDLTVNSRSTAHLDLEDDGVFEADLPFAFAFFGQQYTSVNISSNGYVTFSGDHTPYGNTRAIPYIGPPDNVLMPLWADLNPQDLPSDGQGGLRHGGIFTLSRSVAGVAEWICQWRLPFWLGTHGDPPPSQSQMTDFQLFLRADGTIRFAWAHIGENPNSYSVETSGLEGPASESSWLSLSRGDPSWLRESAVELTPCERGHCPPPNCGCDEHTICDFQPGRLRQQCKACPAGFSGSGRSGCVDQDECDSSDASRNRVCDQLTVCTNTEGGYECSDCPDGYYGQDNGPEQPVECVACQPVDGCLAETCTNSSNSLCAVCPAGTTGAPTEDRGCSSCACGADGSDSPSGYSACRDSPQPQGLACAAGESQMSAIEQLLGSAHDFDWRNCADGQFCRDLSVGTAGRSQLVCIPCSRGGCEDYGLCQGAVRSLGGASRLSTSACNPGSLEWIDTQSVPQPSRCFNGVYSLMTGRGVGMMYSSNEYAFDIELSISGSISPAIASASDNKTVAVYESCQWRGYRVSTCGGTSSVHHLVIVDTSTSPLLNLTSVEMDNSRDELTVSGIGPGSAIIVLTFSTAGVSSCLPEATYRRIFYQAISCTGLPGRMGSGAAPAQGQPPSCAEDPYGIVGSQTCEATLSAVVSFGESCSSPMTDLSLLFGLVGIHTPADLMGSSFAEICPVACDACPSTGTPSPSPPGPASVPAPPPAADPDCIDDRNGALMRARQNCGELVQSAVQMGQIADCSAPLSQLSLIFSIFGVAIGDDMAGATVNDLCPVACGVCVGVGTTAGGHR